MCAKFHDDIMAVINAVRGSFVQAEQVYLYGSCYKFHEILVAAFPHLEVIPYYNVDHVISLIGKRFYDITGEVTDTEKYMDLREEPRSLEFYKGPNKFDFKDPSRLRTWLNFDIKSEADQNALILFHRSITDERLKLENEGYPFTDIDGRTVHEGSRVKVFNIHGDNRWEEAEVKERYFCKYLDTGLWWMWLTDVDLNNKLTVI